MFYISKFKPNQNEADYVKEIQVPFQRFIMRRIRGRSRHCINADDAISDFSAGACNQDQRPFWNCFGYSGHILSILSSNSRKKVYKNASGRP